MQLYHGTLNYLSIRSLTLAILGSRQNAAFQRASLVLWRESSRDRGGCGRPQGRCCSVQVIDLRKEVINSETTSPTE